VAVDETNELIVISFRGSRTISNWISNLDFALTDASDLCDGCEAHSGFLRSWETVSDDITSQIDSALQTYSGYTLVMTGHSLGAALAALGGTALRNAGYTLDLVSRFPTHDTYSDTLQYTYGQPRVGNEALAIYMTDQGSLYRATHTDDIVPKLPPASWGFSHASPEYWITSGNDVPVTTSDIDVIEGVGSTAGNAGTTDPSVEAHNWYIVNIDGCQ
jgi:triacylglycerol lipase